MKVEKPETDEESAFELIRRVIRAIPKGCVVSYGEVAARAGFPRGARTVAWVLRSSTEALPWHRVVRKNGQIAFSDPFARDLQRRLLEAEGVVVGPEHRIDRERFAWSKEL